jgi:hypothetical protein
MVYVDVKLLTQKFKIGKGENVKQEYWEDAHEYGHKVLVFSNEVNVFSQVIIWGYYQGEYKESHQNERSHQPHEHYVPEVLARSIIILKILGVIYALKTVILVPIKGTKVHSDIGYQVSNVED